MEVHRAFHVTFYILYLIMLAIVLWFILFYAGVPGWVWSLFGAAIIIAIIGVIIKEALIKKHRNACDGTVSSPNPLAGWSLMYYIFHITSFLLIIAGIVLVIIYGNYPWWIWVVMGVGIIFIILATMMHVASAEQGIKITGFVFGIIGSIALIVFEILIVVYSNAPWWIWVLIAVMILFGFLSGSLEPISAENLDNAADVCKKPCLDECGRPLLDPCGKPVYPGVDACGRPLPCPTACPKPCEPPPPCGPQFTVGPTPSALTTEQLSIGSPGEIIQSPRVEPTPTAQITQQMVIGEPSPTLPVPVVTPTPPVVESQPVLVGAASPPPIQPAVTQPIVTPTPSVSTSQQVLTGGPSSNLPFNQPLPFISPLPGLGF